MVNNRFLLGFVAFSISFGITLVTSRDLGKALITGVTTLPAAYIASGIVNRRSYLQADNRLITLRYHIQALQQRRVEAYEEFTEMLAEKERVALALNSLQMQVHQLQLTGSAPTSSKTALSWDLAAPEAAPSMRSSSPFGVIASQKQTLHPAGMLPHELPTEIQPPNQPAGKLGRYLSEAEATRRKLESNLNTLQAELAQIKVEIAEYRQLRDQVVQEITHLQEQKHQLETESIALKGEVQALEQCREELEQFLSYTEAKKRELEAGSHPLQIALQELQLQIDSLHQELRSLEAQVGDRRTQKHALEQHLVELNKQQPQPGEPSAPMTSSFKAHKAGMKPGSATTQKSPGGSAVEVGTGKPTSSSIKLGSGMPGSAAHGAIALPEFPKPKPEKVAQDLPSDWIEFMAQISDYEVRVLKAIAEQTNPAATLKQIAEENLTMPELLIDSINERALDVLGDLVIESKAGASSATIAREHQKTVKKLVKLYEYPVK